jgi:hypothetical protein
VILRKLKGREPVFLPPTHPHRQWWAAWMGCGIPRYRLRNPIFWDPLGLGALHPTPAGMPAINFLVF